MSLNIEFFAEKENIKHIFACAKEWSVIDFFVEKLNKKIENNVKNKIFFDDIEELFKFSKQEILNISKSDFDCFVNKKNYFDAFFCLAKDLRDMISEYKQKHKEFDFYLYVSY